jgi:integrase/recombinase XerD
MPKGTHFTIRKTNEKRPWCLDVPSELSETGKRRRMFYSTEREAKAEKERREFLLLKGGLDVAKVTTKRAMSLVDAEKLLKGDDLVGAVTAYQEAIDALQPYGVGITEAVDFFLACHTVDQSRSFEELAEEYRILKEGKRPQYRRDIERVLGHFGKALREVFSERGLDSPSVRTINSEITKEALESLNLTIHDFNLHRRTLNPLFNWAVQNRWMDENPLKTIPTKETPHREILSLTNLAVEALIESCDEKSLPFFGLAIFAGIRPDEINKLTVADFNLKRGYIKVAHTVSKTHRKRFAEISTNLLDLLARHPLRDPGLTRSAVESVRRKAEKLLREQGQKKEAQILKEWGHSIMRHTFASNFYAYHKNSERLIKCMGHVDLVTTANHYLNLVDPDDARSFWNIGLPEGETNLQLVV